MNPNFFQKDFEQQKISAVLVVFSGTVFRFIIFTIPQTTSIEYKYQNVQLATHEVSNSWNKVAFLFIMHEEIPDWKENKKKASATFLVVLDVHMDQLVLCVYFEAFLRIYLHKMKAIFSPHEPQPPFWSQICRVSEKSYGESVL